MTEVTETPLPGLGVRHEFSTGGGERVAVVSLRSGRREILVYDEGDPDRCRSVVHLDEDDARTLSEVLGASRVAETVAAVQHVEGLAIDWVTVPPGSSQVGSTIGAGRFRTETGVSIIAIARGDTTLPAPGPETTLEADDVVIVTGTDDGLAQFRQLVQ